MVVMLVNSCLIMSCDDTALELSESLYTLNTFATKSMHKPKSPTLSVKLPGELVTSDLCSSSVEDFVWVMVGYVQPIQAVFTANYRKIVKPMKLFPNINIAA